MLHMILSTPWQTHNGVTFTCVSSWKQACWEGVGRFSTLKCVFFFYNSCSIPTEQTLQFVQRELQHLARQTLLTEHVAGGTVACVWYYHLPAVLNFIWIGMKRSGRRCSLEDVYLKPRLFFFLLPHSNFRYAKWLDIVFYTAIPSVPFGI